MVRLAHLSAGIAMPPARSASADTTAAAEIWKSNKTSASLIVSAQRAQLVHSQVLTAMLAIKLLKNPFVLVPLIAGVLLPCIALLVVRSTHPPKPPPSDLDLKDAVVISGRPLPHTELLSLDGRQVPPEILRKGKVLLVFLTTHCQACQKEFRLLSTVESQGSPQVKFYGIGVEDKSLLTDFIKENQVSTQVVWDQHGELMKSLSVKYFPTSFLVQDGVITNTWFGNSPSQTELFKRLGL
jgi:peroxiredoxin